MKIPGIPNQFIPLILLFAVLIATLLIARDMLVPDSFGDIGHYRADAVGEIASLEIVYAGADACAECHDDIYETKLNSNHSGVSCEVCHGPAANHIEDQEEFMPHAPRTRDDCQLCHGYNMSRPSGFPQILPDMHNPGKACMTCHNPHDPQLPHAPEDCSACHREISSVKMVSHHTDIPCVRCHKVPKEHLTSPRNFHAEKPVSRSLCGECHSRGADSPSNIPRIDLEFHGNRYLCWDCHYPHSPEAGK